jgi:acetamidase/formamidase
MPRSPLAGAWILVERGFDETRVSRLYIQGTDNRFAGQVRLARQADVATLEGTIDGSRVTFTCTAPDNGEALRTYTGRLADGALAGRVTWGAFTHEWEAHRPVTRAAGQPPTTHVLRPTRYSRVVSAAVPPVLRLFPGDTVRTSAVDSEGRDHNGEQRVLGGNPLTGPFYIEGAIPGDTLVVHLHRVQPNRSWAVSGCRVIGSALPHGARRNGGPPEPIEQRWHLDRDQGIAVPDPPSPSLKDFSIPLRPMLGFIGVAPEGPRVVTSHECGAFGGNLDYKRIGAGAHVYLPVFHEGALLFVGDGHAAQADGEITGDALETSMDLEFTLDVQTGRDCGVPRVETADALIALGVGGSLDKALQSATAATASAIERQYRLDPVETAIVLGFAIEYDIAGLAGPQVSVAARLPKQILNRLSRA